MSVDLTYHGVRYIPESSAPQSSLTIHDLKREGTKYVRITWVDLVNNIRYRIIPLPFFEKLLQTSRPGTSITKASFGIIFAALADGFNPTGEYLYAIDLSSLRLCPYASGHASVLGWFEEKTPLPGLTGMQALEVDLCPRTILRRVVEHAREAAGVEFLVGFETEFILLKNVQKIEAVNQHGYCNSTALLTGTPETQALEEIADALMLSGIELQAYHAEAAPGQYEVVTGPMPPLQAADALIHTRETIFNIASKHGLTATLAPRVFLDNCGSAAHAHMSIHSTKGASARPSAHENLSEVEAQFLAGLLEHLPYLTLLALPTEPSYKRMADGVWSGGTYVCWGTDNREAPVRLCNASSPSSRNFELKTLDGTANPYLALAGVLGAGLAGVLTSKELEIKDCAGEKSAAQLSEEGRKALGITARMPLTWEEARTKFAKSVIVDSVFGEDFKAKFLSANKTLKEQMTFGLMDDEALKLMIEVY
ncbi:glutamine synthetase/guanido kinase [Pholiota conissans]|uniref:Glutamine synthetase/guanido kinase n=1 Tax=Pholiota conissans TaxID=109636 RepID=A0A9P5Z9L6_9AGAR|nr:glutamine synthetase/guanido kinase [Pholiota conissans]